MDVKPVKGLKVKINASREAVFGEDGVEVKKVSSPVGRSSAGTLTGRTLVGYAEVEMAAMDGKNHWYPVDQILTEKGDKVVEEEVAIEVPEDAEEEGDGEEE
ncbi:MAG: hypothetical protein JRN09_02690 [Nitrososphaerota archaeon]|jgi:hypothetical protein|nr:hypothetical protein [Nitrososphaerota archaeon]